MQVKITDFVHDKDLGEGEFDEIWRELGTQIKHQLRTFDPDVTWLNLYVSHDGRPSFNRTLVRTQEQENG
jgi:hypothetical protein